MSECATCKKDALNTLPAPDPPQDPVAEAETIEIQQVPLSEPVLRQLMAVGERAGVNVLLCLVNWPALRIRG